MLLLGGSVYNGYQFSVTTQAIQYYPMVFTQYCHHGLSSVQGVSSQY